MPSAVTTPPSIVVADAKTLGDDVDWGPLEAVGDLHVYPGCTRDNVVPRCRHATVVLINKQPLDESIIQQLPGLRLISVLATGVNVVDVRAAAKQGITVCNVPAYSTKSVAQHTIALMLELTNRVSDHARAARDGRWTRSGEFSYRVAPIRELADKQLGIVGLGAIGGAVARIAQALGMRVVAAHSRAAASGAPAGSLSVPGSPHIERLPLEELLATSDVVSLHCPLTPQTRHLVNHERLQTMKPTALLLNTGRGALVDEDALIDALRSGSIAGAGLDVLQAEPPPPDHPLLQLERCLITPHLAWATTESIQRLLNATVENVKAFLAGHPQNVVSA